ncbi:MAG: hypothetical protein R2839_04740 [Thermomicrobiales bacterium]
MSAQPSGSGRKKGGRSRYQSLSSDSCRQGRRRLAARFTELAAKGETGCPVSNALRGNVPITLDASLAS